MCNTNEIEHSPINIGQNINIGFPSNILLLGPAGSGTENLVLDLIRLVGNFDRIVLLTKDMSQLFRHLLNTFRRIEQERNLPHKIFYVCANEAEIPPVVVFDHNEKNLIIVDQDFCESPEELRKVTELCCQGRMHGLSMIFMSEDYESTPNSIRSNSNYILIKELTIYDASLIPAEWSLGKTQEEFLSMYIRATRDNPITDFFMVDLVTTDPAFRFRHNYNPIEQ